MLLVPSRMRPSRASGSHLSPDAPVRGAAAPAACSARDDPVRCVRLLPPFFGCRFVSAAPSCFAPYVPVLGTPCLHLLLAACPGPRPGLFLTASPPAPPLCCSIASPRPRPLGCFTSSPRPLQLVCIAASPGPCPHLGFSASPRPRPPLRFAESPLPRPGVGSLALRCQRSRPWRPAAACPRMSQSGGRLPLLLFPSEMRPSGASGRHLSSDVPVRGVAAPAACSGPDVPVPGVSCLLPPPCVVVSLGRLLLVLPRMI